MTIYAQFVILWDFEFFKKDVVALTYVKFELIVLIYYTNILHPSRNFGIEFSKLFN